MKNVIRDFVERLTRRTGSATDSNSVGSKCGWLTVQVDLSANFTMPIASLALGLAMVFVRVPAFAATQDEYRALQQWCVGRDKWTAEGRKIDYPNPPEYLHFHHYCSAQSALKSLYSATGKVKMNYAASQVMGETNYVISHVPESHTLMPEVYALRGKAMAIVKQNAQAESNLLKALQLDPKHVAAYVTLGNYYLDTKRRAKAEETVKAGLAVDAQNKALRRLASELGIKLEAMKPEAVVAEPVAVPTSKAEVIVMEPVPERPKVAPSPPASETPLESSKIGSPTNPWCRFCPDPVTEP